MDKSINHIAIIGLLVTSFLAACAQPRTLTFSGVEPKNSDHAQSIQIDPEVTTRLPTAGDVLIAGGIGGRLKTLQAAEFYDPTTLKFSLTGRMASSRVSFGAAAFTGGALNHIAMVAGGASGSDPIRLHTLKLRESIVDTAELYDPTTGKFTATGRMIAGSALFTTTQLLDGTVLIAGGVDFKGTPLNTSEIFDPSSGNFTATAGPMNMARAFHTATLLNDGAVLIAGGVSGVMLNTTDTTEIYDPVLKTFMANVAAPMILGTAGHTATLISGCTCAVDGKVVMTGGFTATAETAARPTLTLAGAREA